MATRRTTATLDEALKKQGVEMIAPHRSNRHLKTQDGRRLRRYARRWIVERYFAWLQWKRRLVVRWEDYASNFLGFVELASITMLLKRSSSLGVLRVNFPRLRATRVDRSSGFEIGSSVAS